MHDLAIISDSPADLEALRSELREIGKRAAQKCVTRGGDLHASIYESMPDEIAINSPVWREIELGFRREWRNARRRK